MDNIDTRPDGRYADKCDPDKLIRIDIQPNGHPDPGYTRVVHKKWHWCPMYMALVSFGCCSVCGSIAIVYAFQSYLDHRAKKFSRSKHRARLAKLIAVVGIMIGLILLSGVIFAASLLVVNNEMIMDYAKKGIMVLDYAYGAITLIDSALKGSGGFGGLSG